MLALAMPRRMSEELNSTQIMATLKACVQKMRKDGFFPVYIRVTHNRTTQYIKTDKMVTKRELSRSNIFPAYITESGCECPGSNANRGTGINVGFHF